MAKPVSNQLKTSGTYANKPLDERVEVNRYYASDDDAQNSIRSIESMSGAYVGLHVYVTDLEKNGTDKRGEYVITKLTSPGNDVDMTGVKSVLEFIGAASQTSVTTLAEKVDKLPVGMYYGSFTSVENLPDAEYRDYKGYAYVPTTDAGIYYIYTTDGDGTDWVLSENKFYSTNLETNLANKSEDKAPTTKIVAEGIEAIDMTLARSAEDENELTATQKYNASANINDRIADTIPVTGEVKALGYKVLNPNKSFAEQITDANTIYEIKDEFDLGEHHTEELSDTVTLGDRLYVSKSSIELANGETITINEDGGKILNESKNTVLGTTTYTNNSESTINVYLSTPDIVGNNQIRYSITQNKSAQTGTTKVTIAGVDYYSTAGILLYNLESVKALTDNAVILPTDKKSIISDSNNEYLCTITSRTVYIAYSTQETEVQYSVTKNYTSEVEYIDTGINATTYNISNAISINANNSLIIDSNAILLDSEKKRRLEKRLFVNNSDTSVEVYLASSLSSISYTIGTFANIRGNSKLKFNGGKLKNGILYLNNTVIESNYKCFDFVTFTSSSRVSKGTVNISWFANSGEDIADVLSWLLRIQMLSKINLDVMKGGSSGTTMKLSHPVEVQYDVNLCGLDKKMGRESQLGMSTIIPTNDWDSKGYPRNTFFYVNENRYHTIQIKNLRLKGIVNENNVDYYKVGYAIYGISMGSSLIKDNIISNFYIAGIRLAHVEGIEITGNDVSYCGTLLVTTPFRIDENNVLNKLTETEKQGSTQGFAMGTIHSNKFHFGNYGIVGVGGQSELIQSNSISHTSCYGIFLNHVVDTCSIKDNYFEALGRSCFWIDKNGFDGIAIPDDYSNIQMCNHVLYPHLGEFNYYVESGWGLFIDNDMVNRYRAGIMIFNAIASGSGEVSINSNMFSCYVIRSSDGYINDNTVAGLDALIGSSGTKCILYDNNTGTGAGMSIPVRTRYYYISPWYNNVSNNYLNTEVWNIPNNFIRDNITDWAKLSMYTPGNLYYFKPPEGIRYSYHPWLKSKCRDTTTSQVTVNSVGDITQKTEFYKEDNGELFYKIPVSTYQGIAFSIPTEIVNCGMILSCSILNEDSSKTAKFSNYILKLVGNSVSNIGYKYVSSANSVTISAKSKITRYFYISPEDIVSGQSEFILSINGIASASVTNTNVYVSIPRILRIGEFINYEEALNTVGETVKRPTLIPVGFQYFDTTLSKPIYWNGTIWVDSNGESVGLQVKDTTVLLEADASSKTINVYSSSAITATAQNPDGSTTDLWLTASVGSLTSGAYPVTLTANSANSTNPRGAKVIISNGTDVVIVNVVQNYATT